MAPREYSEATRSETQIIPGPRGARRLLAILAYLATAPKGATLSDLARAVSAPKTSVLSLTRSLIELGYIDRRGDKYFIGPAMKRLAQTVSNRYNLVPTARPVLEKLCGQVKESVAIAIFDFQDKVAIYNDVLQGATGPIRYVVTLGEARALYSCSAGRAILAYQPSDWIESYLASVKMKKLTTRTIVDPQAIRERLETIRIRGWEISEGEVAEGGIGIAAPIFDSDGRVIACINVAGPTARMTDRVVEIAAKVVAAAKDISKRCV